MAIPIQPECVKNCCMASQLPRPLLRYDDNYGSFCPDGGLPPHVYAHFSTQSSALCSPRCLRTTLTALFLDKDVQNASALPIAAVWQPLYDTTGGNESVPVEVDVSEGGLLRCNRCGAHFNPFFTFEGRTFRCNLCGLIQLCHKNFAQTRQIDIKHAGICDFLLESRNFQTTYLLYIDITEKSLEIGLPCDFFTSLDLTIDQIPYPDSTYIAISAYSSRFFYYKPAHLPCELISCDIDPPYAPDSITALRFHIGTQRKELKSLLTWLKGRQDWEPGSDLLTVGTVVEAALDLAPLEGLRVIIVAANCGKVGKFSPKITIDRAELLREELSNSPLSSLIDSANKSKICIDFFSCSQGNAQSLPSIYPLCAGTGGDLHRFCPYTAHREDFHYTLFHTLTRPQVYDVSLKVRCSEGLEVEEYLGNIPSKCGFEVHLPICQSDFTLTVVLKHTRKLVVGRYYVQAAALFTTLQGKRILRVCNGVFSATADDMAVYKGADCEAIATVMAKKQVKGVGFGPALLTHWRKWLISLLIHYRNVLPLARDSNSLLLPEGLETLPVLTLGAMRQKAFDVNADVDSIVASLAKICSFSVLQAFLRFYPRIYRVDNLLAQSQAPGTQTRSRKTALPVLVPASITSLSITEAYLFDNGEKLVLYIGREVPLPYLHSTFGVNTWSDIVNLPENCSPANERLLAVIAELHRRNPGPFQALRVALDSTHAHLKAWLVEDPGSSAAGYWDFLRLVQTCVAGSSLA